MEVSKHFIGIDPGPKDSAICVYSKSFNSNTWYIWNFKKLDNSAMLSYLDNQIYTLDGYRLVAIEMVACYGMAVGAEVFETAFWAGKFHDRVETRCDVLSHLVYRKEVKINLCNSMKAKDANIRQAIIDRFGGKEKAIGNKKNPGQLYKMAGDCWAALAVALTAKDKYGELFSS
jgi:hypothetical protein